MSININVDNQRLRVNSNLKEIISGSKNFVSFKFNLSSDWDGLTVSAQFIQNGTATTVSLDLNDSCNLPQSIRPGIVKLLLHGTGQNIIATTEFIEFTVLESNYIQPTQ